jgi:hypothetical protein
MYPLLRLDQRVWQPLRMPGLLLTKAAPFKVLLPAGGLVVLVGAFSLSFEGAGWIFALLVLSAAVTAIAQQTLP